MIAMYIIIGMSILAVGAYAWFIHAYQHGYSEQKTPVYSDGSSDYVPARRVERERDRRNKDFFDFSFQANPTPDFFMKENFFDFNSQTNNFDFNSQTNNLSAFSCIEINPANGVPMLEGSGIDIQGNSYGFDH